MLQAITFRATGARNEVVLLFYIAMHDATIISTVFDRHVLRLMCINFNMHIINL